MASFLTTHRLARELRDRFERAAAELGLRFDVVSLPADRNDIAVRSM